MKSVDIPKEKFEELKNLITGLANKLIKDGNENDIFTATKVLEMLRNETYETIDGSRLYILLLDFALLETRVKLLGSNT